MKDTKKHSPLLEQTVKNSMFSLLGTLATFVIMLLFAGFRIRFLGVERAGYMMLLESVIEITIMLGGFGIGTAALRRIAIFYGQNKIVDIRRTLGSALFVNITIGLVIAISIILGFDWIFKWSKTSEVFRVDAFVTSILLGISFFVRQFFATHGINNLFSFSKI